MSMPLLQPFPFQGRLRDHFKEKKKTWEWFSDEKNKNKQVEAFKSKLLKNTYRLDRQAHPKLYEITNDICEKLSIDAQVTLYQENNSVQLNAGISIIDKEAHIVLSGNILSLLHDEELKALLAHELSHYLFYKTENDSFETTNRIILALANDEDSNNSTIETARVYRLYMELFCDAGALLVCENYATVIKMLVKLNTGLRDVDADSYLKQANEIIREDKNGTQQDTHPESYVRSIALQLRSEGKDDYLDQLRPLIEGPLDINRLDIFEQKDLELLTHHILLYIVQPAWMNSESVKNLQRQYFPNPEDVGDKKSTQEIKAIVKAANPNIHGYLSYVLLDFARVDLNMEGAPLAHTLELAELFGLKTTYEKTLRKELKLTVRDFKKLKMRVANDLSEMLEDSNNSKYDG